MAEDDPKIGRDAGEDASVAKAIADVEQTARPGGGGLGGEAAASDPLDQSGRGDGGNAPNSPIDFDCPHPEGPSDVAGHEAAQRAAGDAPEDKPTSR